MCISSDWPCLWITVIFIVCLPQSGTPCTQSLSYHQTTKGQCCKQALNLTKHSHKSLNPGLRCGLFEQWRAKMDSPTLACLHMHWWKNEPTGGVMQGAVKTLADMYLKCQVVKGNIDLWGLLCLWACSCKKQQKQQENNDHWIAQHWRSCSLEKYDSLWGWGFFSSSHLLKPYFFTFFLFSFFLFLFFSLSHSFFLFFHTFFLSFFLSGLYFVQHPN